MYSDEDNFRWHVSGSEKKTEDRNQLIESVALRGLLVIVLIIILGLPGISDHRDEGESGTLLQLEKKLSKKKM